MYVATCLLTEKTIWEKDRWRSCVQEDCASDVPGQEVEQLDVVQDLMQHLAVLGSFLLLLRQKYKGYREPNSHLYPHISVNMLL